MGTAIDRAPGNYVYRVGSLVILSPKNKKTALSQVNKCGVLSVIFDYKYLLHVNYKKYISISINNCNLFFLCLQRAVKAIVVKGLLTCLNTLTDPGGFCIACARNMLI